MAPNRQSLASTPMPPVSRRRSIDMLGRGGLHRSLQQARWRSSGGPLPPHRRFVQHRRCWRSSKIAFCDHRKSRCRIDEGRGWRGGASPGVRLAITSFEQFGDGDRLVAAGAWGSDAGGPHEGVAVGAVLVAERAGVAVVADVDGHGPLGAFGRDGWPWDGGGVASAPGGLAAGVGAVTAPTGRHEVGSAVRTGPYRYAIVTRRAVSGHGGLLGWRWAVGRRRGGGWLR
jgi:hypothetical protein